MNYEEAIKILHPDTTYMALSEIEYFGGFKGKEAKLKAVNEACITACEAIKKQIQMKPNDKCNVPYTNVVYGTCPSCGLGVDLYMKFCSVCGQAIDWSEDS